jgi:hypothetical protein
LGPRLFPFLGRYGQYLTWYWPQEVNPPCFRSRHPRLLVEFVQRLQLQMKSIAGAGAEAATPTPKTRAAIAKSFLTMEFLLLPRAIIRSG